MKTDYHQLVNLLESGDDYQLGILIDTKGSAPQLPGALAVFKNDNVVYGTLGGGLLEYEAQKAASKAYHSKKNSIHLVEFLAEVDTNAGAICGGTGTFLMDTNPNKHLAVFIKMLDALNQGNSGNLISILKKENENLSIQKYWIDKNEVLPSELEDFVKQFNLNLSKILTEKKTHWIHQKSSSVSSTKSNISLFIEPISPLSKLIIVGAGHIGQALLTLAQLANFEVTVIDNRVAYLNSTSFKNANLKISDQLSEAFKTVKITKDTYIVIVSQGHRTDIEALRWCIQSNAAYIGVIGSKRKFNLIRSKFLIQQWACDDELKFINSPIGINIHSKTVNEIAISIVAQLIKRRHKVNYIKPPKNVSSVVLAAGKSTRMGTQKLLLPYQKTTIIESIIQKLNASNTHQTIVVIGSHKSEIKAKLENSSILLIENLHYDKGMLSSVQTGILSVDLTSDAVLIALGDQPMITTELVNRLIAVFNKSDKGIIVPVFNGKRGHPVLISRTYFSNVNNLNPEIGLRALLAEFNDDVLEISVQSEDILIDIDTREDYLMITNKCVN